MHFPEIALLRLVKRYDSIVPSQTKPYHVGIYLIWLASLIVCRTALPASNPVFHNREKPFTARVDILALQSAVLHSYAGGQETFLARVQVHGEQHLAVLIDRYNAADYPIRETLLAARRPFLMRLTRDENCDEPATSLSGSLTKANVFDPALTSVLAQQNFASLTCFVVEHQRTRLAHDNKYF